MAILEKTLRLYLLDQSNVTDALGGSYIYAGRAPQTVSPLTYMLIRRISGEPSYHLGGEDDFSVRYIAIDAYSRGVGAEYRVHNVAEKVRLEISGWKGMWSSGDNEIMVWGCTLESGISTRRISPSDASDDWTIANSSTYKITYSQTEPTLGA